jgi:hypothetical protein
VQNSNSPTTEQKLQTIMAILFSSLPKKRQEAIANLQTLVEIGTGFDMHDEIIDEALQAISFLLTAATLDNEVQG